jgi:spore coat protein A, manganese oxidase
MKTKWSWLVVLLAAVAFGSSAAQANQQVVQKVLDGSVIPKFVEPVPTFNGNRVNGTHPLEISAQEFQQQILPASFYAGLPESVSYKDMGTGKVVARINPRKGTYLWGYKIKDEATNRSYGPQVPGFTIEARRGTRTHVHYLNDLDPFGRLPGPLLQKFLTVDLSFHWANPLNQSMSVQGGDPSTGLDLGNPAFYAGPQPMTVHLHGAEVPSAFDGGPDSWFTPGEAIKGPSFVSDQYTYPNAQDATALWYHDHVLGETRLTVYSGLMGFYLLRGAPESEVSPPLPSGNYEVELAIQDRQFDTNGQLFFPDGNPAGTGLNGDPGNPAIHPYAIPEFFGDVIVVNGKSWPYLKVEPRRYRFRFLDGCNARMLALRIADERGKTSGPSVPTIWQIGSDGGLLDKPVAIDFTPFTIDPGDTTVTPYGSPTLKSSRLFLAPAERMDVIVDFSGFEGKTFTLVNDANTPFPGDDSTLNPNVEGKIMQFRVTRHLSSADSSFNPAAHHAALRRGPAKMVRLADGKGGLADGVTVDNARRLVLIEQEDPDTGAPVKVLINNTSYDGQSPMGSFAWQDGQPIPEAVPFNQGNIQVTEMPQVGSTEIWEFVNLTADAHPIHIHLIQFQVLNRQVFKVGTEGPDAEPPFTIPPTQPFFTTPGYRTDAYEAAWPGYSPLDNNGFGGTRYGAGPPLDYLSATPMGGNPDVTPYLVGEPIPPDPNEAGWKDTLKMYPGTVTRLVIRWAPQDVEVDRVSAGENKFPFDPTATLRVRHDDFGYPGGPGYMMHCHILDHEDNDMMRPFELSNRRQK